MINAPPERIEAWDDDLRSLCNTLTGYGLSEDGGKVWALWFLRGNMPPLLVVSDSRDIVFKFEVFSLAMRTPEQALSDAIANRDTIAAAIGQLGELGAALPPIEPLPEHLTPDRTYPWPFKGWCAEVLWERDWTIPLERVSADWRAKPDTQFGAVPDGADHTCLVAKGLLFTGADGSQLLVSQGEMPLDLLVTQDAAMILATTIGTRAVAVDQYLTEPAPAF